MTLAARFAVASLIILTACMTREEPLQAGALYSVDHGDGKFRVAKLLVVDGTAAHIRLYKNSFAARPERVEISELTLGTIHDADGFGMGHMPLARTSFLAWKPKFITATTVTEEELEGYEMWKEAGGGLFQ